MRFPGRRRRACGCNIGDARPRVQSEIACAGVPWSGRGRAGGLASLGRTPRPCAGTRPPARVALVCGELEEARRPRGRPSAGHRGLRVEEPEIALPVCVSLVGGELVKARGLALVLRQAATALLVKDPEIGLRPGVFPGRRRACRGARPRDRPSAGHHGPASRRTRDCLARSAFPWSAASL